jgi:hypothetical protein
MTDATSGEGRPVLELVVFKVKEGVTREQLLGTVDAVSIWARAQPGFVSRDLTYDAEGDRWVEIIWWATMADAEASAKAAETAEECAPMFALIDPEQMQFLHAEPAIAHVAA